MDRPDVFKVYCNIANVGFSNFDFTIDIGQKKNPASPALEPDELLGQIVMSPQHFKAFVGVLRDNLEKYEAIFGQINLDPNQDAVKRFGVGATSPKQ